MYLHLLYLLVYLIHSLSNLQNYIMHLYLVLQWYLLVFHAYMLPHFLYSFIHYLLRLFMFILSILMYVYLSRTIYNMLHSHLYLDYLLLDFHSPYYLSSITYTYHDLLLDLHTLMNYSMLSLFHLVLHMFTSHFHLYHSSSYYTFMLINLSYPTYFAHYMYCMLLTFMYLRFLLHLYRIDSTFLPLLHPFMLCNLSHLLLSYNLMLPDLLLFTYILLLLILHLHMFMLISVSLLSHYLLYSNFLPAS